MSPVRPRFTASGLIIAKVLSIAIWITLLGFSPTDKAGRSKRRPYEFTNGGTRALPPVFPLRRCLLRRAFLRATLFQDAGHRLADFPGTLHRMNSGRLHRAIFIGRRALPAADDCTSMSHPTPRRRRLPGNKPHHRLAHMLLDVSRRQLLSISANFANHHDRIRPGILVEHPN